jgi:hypothetical protein
MSTTINVRNTDGTLASTRPETTAAYTPGGQTEDSYMDATGIARVTYTKYRR